MATRTKLGTEKGKRKKFQAIVSRFGKKVNYKGYSEETVLLTMIKDLETNINVADHLWFCFTKGFEKANIKEGNIIEFEARVKEYKKGYVNKQLGINNKKKDFKLSHTTNIVVKTL